GETCALNEPLKFCLVAFWQSVRFALGHGVKLRYTLPDTEALIVSGLEGSVALHIRSPPCRTSVGEQLPIADVPLYSTSISGYAIACDCRLETKKPALLRAELELNTTPW